MNMELLAVVTPMSIYHEEICRKRVDPSTKSTKRLKLYLNSKIGRGHIIISPLYNGISRYNFTDCCPRGLGFAFIKNLKFDQVINCQNMAQIGTGSFYNVRP